MCTYQSPNCNIVPEYMFQFQDEEAKFGLTSASGRTYHVCEQRRCHCAYLTPDPQPRIQP
jgi:hypothetical protein